MPKKRRQVTLAEISDALDNVDEALGVIEELRAPASMMFPHDTTTTRRLLEMQQRAQRIARDMLDLSVRLGTEVRAVMAEERLDALKEKV